MQYNLENYKNIKIILTDKYIIFIGPLGIIRKKTNFFSYNIQNNILKINNINYNNIYKYICKESINNKTKFNLINLDYKLNNVLQKKDTNILKNIITKNIHGILYSYALTLKLNGIGFKYVIKQDNILILRLGYSHYINYELPKNIFIKQISETEFMLLSNNYNLLQNTAAKIRTLKKPNFYKGNGILYNDEIIIKKKQKTNKK